MKTVWEDVETSADLNLLPKSDQDFITGVWNTETCDLAYTRKESNKYFQSLVL